MTAEQLDEDMKSELCRIYQTLGLIYSAVRKLPDFNQAELFYVTMEKFGNTLLKANIGLQVPSNGEWPDGMLAKWDALT